MEDNTSNIFPGLDQDTLNALMSSEKNWNTDFKGNGPGAVAQKALKVVDFTAKLPNLVTYVVSYVTGIVTTYMANSTADMLSIDPSQIVTNAAAKLPSFIKSPAEILGELTKDAEDIAKELENKGDTNLMENLNKSINDQVGKFTNKINDNLSGVDKTIEDIGKYAYMGPSWIKNKIDLESKRIIENCSKQISSVRDSVKSNVQGQIDSLAEGLAKRQAEEINQKTHDAVKAPIDKANKEKAKATSKAKTAITNAKLKIMALIGG